jgi:hypothetical protein
MNGPAALAVPAIQRLPRWLSLDPEDLLARAAQLHGSDDFGSSNYADALRRLVGSLETSACLSPFGRALTRVDLLRHMGNALLVQQARLGRVAAAHEPVRAPLVITGLPRSGSTFLHRLLSQDPAHRVLRHWEAMRPVRQGRSQNQLRWKTRFELAAARLLAPRLAAVHPMESDSPQECTELLGASMVSLRFDSTYDVPDYRAWVDAEGSEGAFRFHKQILQLLQAQRHLHGTPPPRWVLKSPDHVFALPALLKVYPDAQLILTHRDPLRVLPSVAHLTYTLHRLFSNSVDRHHVGAKVLERWAHGAALTAAAAARPNALSLSYKDIVKHPIETVRTIYRRFHWELSPLALRRMEQFLRQHPRGGYARNRYELSDYGFSEQGLIERFCGYNARMAYHLGTMAASP